MKGNAEVIEILGDVLSAELTAINQYCNRTNLIFGWYSRSPKVYENQGWK